MYSIAKAFFALFGLYLFAIIAMNKYTHNSQSLRTLPNNQLYNLKASNNSISEDTCPRFRNPALAYKALSVLDRFRSVDDSYFYERKARKNRYHKPYYGLKSDDNYCKNHRMFFVHHPESIFDEINMVLTAPFKSLVRQTIAQPIANDIHPKVGSTMPANHVHRNLYPIKTFANYFYTKTPMFEHKHVGKHFSCLTQVSNHIPGHSSLDRKDFVAENAVKYGELFKDRPQCFSYDKFFPKTWLLYNEETCKEFFTILNSTQYKKLKKERHIVFIRKIATHSHRGEGVQPVHAQEEQELRRIYDNGNLCGNVTKNYIVQNYIHNPLLLNGHKFDFRMYMLIASTNPLMAFYHDGFLRVTLAKYDVKQADKKALLTNLALNKQIYDSVIGGNLYEGMDEEALKMAQQWSFDRLQEYLLEKGIINDPNWLDNYLRPEFKKAMIHLLRLSSASFLKRSSLYELYGVDFMLDENLNLWFIEANSSPAIEGYSIPMEKFIVKMAQDHFEVIMGLLRSRVKRIINHVNDLIDRGLFRQGKNGKVLVNHINEKVKKFEKITRNYFEKEYEPKPTNGWRKIVDENYSGVEAYLGYIEPECM